jgi:predicted amidohydrolase
VHGTKYGKIGWMICYDGAFPESARVLALQGAELIALLTNWPVGGSETSPRYVVPTRAIENRVNYIAVNRVGIERGFRFIGQSRIVDYVGKILAEAGDGEETIYAEIDLAGAREKKTVIIPGLYELDRFQTRSPEFYGLLVDPSLGKQ